MRRLLKFLERALIALVLIGFPIGWLGQKVLADYTMTQGSGLTFASLVIATKHYAALVICDAVAGESQCGAVKAGNTAVITDVAQIVSDPNVVAAVNSSIPGGSNDIGTIGVHSIVNVTPTDCSSTIASGGTAQNAITASATIHGYEIVNIDTTAECLNISKTGTAAANTAGSACLAPATSTTTGGSYNTPLGAGFNTNLSVIAATTGHKFTCTRW